MSKSTTSPPTTGSDDPFEKIRQNREEVERLAEAEQDNSLGAWARVLLALEAGERPADADLELAGIPHGEDGDAGEEGR